MRWRIGLSQCGAVTKNIDACSHDSDTSDDDSLREVSTVSDLERAIDGQKNHFSELSFF